MEELVNVRISLEKSVSEKQRSGQIGVHLGKVGLLTAFLHTDIQWPTGRPTLHTCYEAMYLQLGHILVYVGYCNGCGLQRGFDSTNYVTP